MDRYTAKEMSGATGVPAHVVAYWSKTGLLVPSLSGGAYSVRDLALGLVLAELARLSAPGPVLKAVAARLADDPASWPEHLWISHTGELLDTDTAPASWVVHPPRLAPDLTLALAS